VSNEYQMPGCMLSCGFEDWSETARRPMCLLVEWMNKEGVRMDAAA